MELDRLLYLLFWALLWGVLVGIFTHANGESFWAGFIFGFILGIFGFLLAMFYISDKRKVQKKLEERAKSIVENDRKIFGRYSYNDQDLKEKPDLDLNSHDIKL